MKSEAVVRDVLLNMIQTDVLFELKKQQKRTFVFRLLFGNLINKEKLELFKNLDGKFFLEANIKSLFR